ncbi:MAG TPA: hypothetical protein VK509_14810 [Polyangiales bacterium]|nr:hypothetical protein [Polyangiales bacterium]
MVVLMVGLGCGGDDDEDTGKAPSGSRPDAGGGARRCVDGDDDGFGDFCDSGDDCDDDDPEITDECRRCKKPSDDCPCEVGAKPLYCDPPDLATTENGKTGVLVCSEGTRYCRPEQDDEEKGRWSDCEILFQYATFVPDK